MESDDNVSGEFQRSTRMPLDAVVRLHFEGTVAYQNGFAANVSATGMFVKHPAPPPLGTPLVFEFNLGAERKPVQGAGEVVWVRDKLSRSRPAGRGRHPLRELDTQSRDHIAEALFEYLEQSLAEESYYDPDRLASEIGASPGELDGLPGPLDREPTPEPPPLDLSSVPRLPRLAATPEPAVEVERAAFEVFSPIDSADAKTAAIVREALRDVSRDVSRELPPAPLAGAAATRAARTSPALLTLLVVVLLGAGGWFAWQKWGRGAVEETAAAPVATKPAPPAPEPLSAAPGATTLAEAVGVDPSARSLAADPPASGGSSAPPDEPDETVQPADTEADAAATTAATGTDSAIAAAPSPTDTAPREPLPATTERARRVNALEWREAGGGSELLIAADGGFPPGSFSYSEIGGENPRVLIKLRGMESPFRGATSGSSALARGVRSGYHVRDGGNEIHLVVDLAPPAAKVASLAPSPGGLLLQLTPP